MITIAKPTLTFQDSAGGALLTLSKENGYRLIEWVPDAKTKRRTAATSPWVDGEFDAITPTDGARNGALQVRVIGDSWPMVEGRVQALLAVFDQATFGLSALMGGVTTVWRCRASDAASSFTRDDQATMTRIVTATVMLQPNPTITGAN